MKNKEIILAIDSTDIKEIKNILDELAPAISNVKIGPISFLSNYQSIIDLIKFSEIFFVLIRPIGSLCGPVAITFSISSFL